MINQNNANRVADRLTEKFGISMHSVYGTGEQGEFINFSPLELDKAEGFSIKTIIGWRSILVEFVPGKFSALLIQTMGEADIEKRRVFRLFAENAIKKSAHISMKVNGITVDPLLTEQWPGKWRRLEISLKYIPIVLDEIDDEGIEDIILNCTSDLYAMVVSLLPLFEQEKDDEGNTDGLPEGAVNRIEVNKYERSRLNRAICIERRGTRCLICGFSFEEKYGQLGHGFIHVHHTTPVSRIGDNYVIDPENDLIPVCANCHVMLHRKDPPYSADELKTIINP